MSVLLTHPPDGRTTSALNAATDGADSVAEPLTSALLPVQQGSFDFAVASSTQHKPTTRRVQPPTPAPTFAVQLCDAIEFMRQQPDASLDVIITDPAYSGMNQKLKLGKGKIIGDYKQKGEEGKWFEEFHDTPENYVAFLRECYRALKPNRHIYLMFDSYSLLTPVYT